jgi:hypothetical protein
VRNGEDLSALGNSCSAWCQNSSSLFLGFPACSHSSSEGQYSLGCFPIAQLAREGVVFVGFGAKVDLVIFHDKLFLKSKTTKRRKKFSFFERFKRD